MVDQLQSLSFRQKIDFLRAHAKRLMSWPLACGILIVAVWGWSMSAIQRETDELKETAYRTAATQARTYAEQIERTIAQLDYTLLSLQFQWQENGGKLSLERQLDAGLVPKTTEIAISVFDRHGMAVTTTSAEIRGTKGIASREYFQTHAANTSKDLVISKPVRSILIGRDVVVLSRRLDASDGTFAGVIVAAIEPVFLASFVDETKLGQDDFVAIRSAGGDFYASKTKSGVRSQHPNFIGKPDFDKPSGALYRSVERYTDGKSRIVGWYTTSTYPIMAVVGLSEATLQTGYEPRRREIYLTAMLGSLMLVLATGAGIRQASARAWRLGR